MENHYSIVLQRSSHKASGAVVVFFTCINRNIPSEHSIIRNNVTDMFIKFIYLKYHEAREICFILDLKSATYLSPVLIKIVD